MDSLTHTNSRLRAGRDLSLSSGDDTTLAGALATAEGDMVVSVGGDLTVASVQTGGSAPRCRTALGLSQDVFARMLKLTMRQLAEIERGEANPTAETLERFGRVFGFTLGFVPAERRAPGMGEAGQARSEQEDQ